MGVASTNSALLYVVLCPVGPYFTSGFKPISLLADPQYVRSWPGGCGALKMGANYAPTIYIQVCFYGEEFKIIITIIYILTFSLLETSRETWTPTSSLALW